MNNLELWLIYRLNEWIAASPATFYQSLNWIDQGLWLFVVVVLSALWFVGEPGAIPTRQDALTRLESRRRVLVMLAALVIAYFVTQWLRTAIFHPRPLVNVPLQHPIDPAVWQAIRHNLSAQSGFPSFQMAMLLVVITGIFSLKPWAGYPALLAGGYFGALQIGLGFHWPIDVFAGALVGVLTTSLMLAGQRWWYRLLTPIVLQFEYGQALAYPVGFLILLDLSQKFAGITSLLRVLGYAVGS